MDAWEAFMKQRVAFRERERLAREAEPPIEPNHIASSTDSDLCKRSCDAVEPIVEPIESSNASKKRRVSSDSTRVEPDESPPLSPLNSTTEGSIGDHVWQRIEESKVDGRRIITHGGLGRFKPNPDYSRVVKRRLDILAGMVCEAATDALARREDEVHIDVIVDIVELGSKPIAKPKRGKPSPRSNCARVQQYKKDHPYEYMVGMYCLYWLALDYAVRSFTSQIELNETDRMAERLAEYENSGWELRDWEGQLEVMQEALDRIPKPKDLFDGDVCEQLEDESEVAVNWP